MPNSPNLECIIKLPNSPNLECIINFLGKKNYKKITDAGITNTQLLRMSDGLNLNSFSDAVAKTYKHIMRQKDAEQSQKNKDAIEMVIGLISLSLLGYISVEVLRLIHAKIVATATAFVNAGNDFADFVSQIDLSHIFQLASKAEGSSTELASLSAEAITSILAGLADTFTFGGIPATTITCKAAVALATGYATYYLMENWDKISSGIPGAQTFGTGFTEKVKNILENNQTEKDNPSLFAKFVVEKLEVYIKNKNIDLSTYYGQWQIKTAKSEGGELDIRELVEKFCTEKKVNKDDFLKEMTRKYKCNLKDLEKKFLPAPKPQPSFWDSISCCVGPCSKQI
jgi:hypothetical protein